MTSLIDFRSANADRRSHPRYSDNSPVYVADGMLVRKFRLVDRSEGGARIAVGEGGQLPRHLVLIDPRTGFSHHAVVVWRGETEVGVYFVQAGARYRVITNPRDLGSNAYEDVRRQAS